MCIYFDVDALDASVMPATGFRTRVFVRSLPIIKNLQTSKIIGADIIELAYK